MSKQVKCRIALTADLHIGSKTTPSAVAELFTKIKDKAPDILLVLGDTANTPNWGTSNKSTGTSHVEISNGLDILPQAMPVYMIPGNHDLPSVGQKSSLELLKHRCIIVQEPGTVSIARGVNVYFIPWTHSPIPEIPDVSNVTGFNLLAGHCNIVGTKINEYYSLQGQHYEIAPSDYKNKGYNYCRFGHIHKRIDDYIGAPWHLTYGDVGNPTGFEILTITVDNQFTVEYVPLDEAPKFFSVSTVEEAKACRDIDNVRIITSSNTAIPSTDLDGLKNTIIVKERAKQVVSERDKIGDDTNIVNMFNTWCKKHESKDRAMEILKEQSDLTAIGEKHITTGSLDKIKSIHISNVGPHKDTLITDLDQISNISVTGDNGSGKTFFIDSVFAALYGSFPSRTNTISNYSTGKQSEIELHFEASGEHYRIARVFNSKAKHSANLYKGDELIAGPKVKDVGIKIEEIIGHKDIIEASIFSAQKTDKDLVDTKPSSRKELFQKLLNTEYLLEVGDFYKNQKKEVDSEILIAEHEIKNADDIKRSIVDLTEQLTKEQATKREHSESMAKTDADITDLSGTIDVLAEQLEPIKAASAIAKISQISISKLENEIRDMDSRISTIKAKLPKENDLDNSESLRALINKATAERDEWVNSAQRADKIRTAVATGKSEIDANISTLETNYRKIKQECITSITEIKSQIKNCENNNKLLSKAGCRPNYMECSFISHVKNAPNLMSTLTAKLAEENQNLASTESNHQSIMGSIKLNGEKKHNLAALEDELQYIAASVQNIPDTAKTSEYITKLQASLEKTINSERESGANKERLKEIEFSQKEAQDALIAEKEALKNTSIQAAEYNTKKGEIESLSAKLKAATESKDRLFKLTATADSEIAKLSYAIEEKTKQISNIDSAALLCDQLKVDANAINLLIEGFSKDGIPQLVTDSVFPQVQNILDELLQSMNIPFEVSFKTQKTTKQKTISETLDIVVASNGDERDIADLSPGEKTLLKAAIRIAIAIFQTQRSGNKHKVMIVDEVFDSLDSSKVSDIVYALSLLSAKYNFNQVIAVSHNNDLIEAFAGNIIFSKENNITTHQYIK